MLNLFLFEARLTSKDPQKIFFYFTYPVVEGETEHVKYNTNLTTIKEHKQKYKVHL